MELLHYTEIALMVLIYSIQKHQLGEGIIFTIWLKIHTLSFLGSAGVSAQNKAA